MERENQRNCSVFGKMSTEELEKLLQHTEYIMSYCRACKQRSDFEVDPMRVEAAVFNLMQIGELAKTSLGDGMREHHYEPVEAALWYAKPHCPWL